MRSRSPLTQFTVRLAREAAVMIRALARPRRVFIKTSAADIRTRTDLAVETMIRRRIAAAFPDHAIIGEEGELPDRLDLRRPTWFIDPVDGTTNYHKGLPLYAVNIAFCADGQIVAGATADVMRLRVYHAEAGRGAWLGRTRLSVSSVAALAHSVVSTGFPYDRSTNEDNNLSEFVAIAPQVRDVRRLGCAGLDMAWVASGLLDGYWEQGDGPWDWAVGALLVREAGGRATTYDGSDWHPGDPTMVAANPALHAGLRREIERSRHQLDESSLRRAAILRAPA